MLSFFVIGFVWSKRSPKRFWLQLARLTVPSKSSRPSSCTGVNRAWMFCSLCVPLAVQAYAGQAHAVGLVQVDSSGKILARYAYKDIEAICLVSSRHNKCLCSANLMLVCMMACRPYVSV